MLRAARVLVVRWRVAVESAGGIVATSIERTVILTNAATDARTDASTTAGAYGRGGAGVQTGCLSMLIPVDTPGFLINISFFELAPQFLILDVFQRFSDEKEE